MSWAELLETTWKRPGETRRKTRRRRSRRHKAASRRSQEHDYVFASSAGTPLNWRNVEHRGFDEALKRAKLNRADGKPVLHDCRHTFAKGRLIGLRLTDGSARRGNPDDRLGRR